MSLAQAIILTLKYSSHFSFPLKEVEIYQRLIKHRASHQQIKRELAKLVKNGQVGKTKDFYHLPGQSKLISIRLGQEQLAHPLQHRARSLASQLFSLPGILAFYLTGSLAVGNAGSDGDIDLLVVAYPRTLWITRLFLTLTTSLFSLRRTRKSVSYYGKLCLNLYLTPDSFTLPVSRRSLYTAYELIQAVPLYDPYQTYPHLIAANAWIKEYLPNYHLPKVTAQDNWITRSPEYLKFLDPFAFRLQYLYMKGRITRELVARDCAYFHPHNPGVSVLKKLKFDKL